jgi:hypothetical protein
MNFSAPVEPDQETPPPRRVEISLDRTPQARRLSSGARYAGVAAASCIALAIVVSPARAGFFDFLFPSAQPAMPAYRPPPHFFHRRIAHVEHHQKKIVAAPRHRIVEAKAHPVAPGAVDLMDDDSLRDGDAVMTPTGLRIFVGSEGRHHSQGDFARISDTEGLSRRARSALLAVDAGHAGEQPALVTGRSATDAGISAGVPIVDPRGQKIRYVGP